MKSAHILILLLTILISSCSSVGDCGPRHRCDTSEECQKEYGEHYICIDRTKSYKSDYQGCCAQPDRECINDLCSEQPDICGAGSCYMIDEYYYWCRCDAGMVYDRTDQVRCVPNRCSSDRDCWNKYIAGESGREDTLRAISTCSSEGVCVE